MLGRSRDQVKKVSLFLCLTNPCSLGRARDAWAFARSSQESLSLSLSHKSLLARPRKGCLGVREIKSRKSLSLSHKSLLARRRKGCLGVREIKSRKFFFLCLTNHCSLGRARDAWAFARSSQESLSLSLSHKSLLARPRKGCLSRKSLSFSVSQILAR